MGTGLEGQIRGCVELSGVCPRASVGVRIQDLITALSGRGLGRLTSGHPAPEAFKPEAG